MAGGASARGGPPGSAGRRAGGWLGWLRLDLVRLVALAPPALAAGWLLSEAIARYASGRLAAAVALAPLAVAALALAATLRGERPRALGWRYLAFFPVFCALFASAAATDLLSGERRLLAGYDEEVPRNFLALNRLGDWHYGLLPPPQAEDRLLVVTFPSFAGELRGEVRRRFAFLLRQARTHGARAVAFDYFFEKEAPVDPLLAAEMRAAEKAGTAVVLGFRQTEEDGRLVRQPLTETIAAAVPARRQGHLAGYLEADGRVRAVPLELPGAGGEMSLAYRVAELGLGAGPPLDEGRLLRFVRPRWGVPSLEFAPDADWSRLRDRFVFVGTAAATDRVLTPFGAAQGVEVHAWTAHSLLTGRSIRRLNDRWMMPLVYLLCFLLTVHHARGAHGRRLVLGALVLSAVAISLAAAAIRFELVWVEVSYPLAAIWSLTGLLLAGAVMPRFAAGAAVFAPAVGEPSEAEAAGVPAGVLPAGVPAVSETSAAGVPVWVPVGVPAVSEEAISEKGAPAGAAGSSSASEGAAAARGFEGEPAEPPGGFDVFLSHNGRDKPIVRQLAAALRARRLDPWLDEERLVPGRPWQEGLEQIIRTVASAAVLVGPDGLGPWEVPEMRACLSEAVRRGLPVIPVLLPGAGKRPDLPIFLTQYTWVDLRAGLSEEGLDRLEWGVTGVKPAGLKARAA